MPETTPTVVPVVAAKTGMSMMVKLLLLGIYTLVVVGVAVGGSFLLFRAMQPPAPQVVGQNPVPTPVVTPTPTPNPTPTPPAQPKVDVTLYFYKGGFTQADQDQGVKTLVATTRQAASDADLYTFALNQLALGPNSAEKAAGMRQSFSFSGTSTCGGADFTLTKTGSKVKVALCRDLDNSYQNPPQGGTYAGMTMTIMGNTREEIKQTLKFGGVTTVEIRDKAGQCYSPDIQDSDCAAI